MQAVPPRATGKNVSIIRVVVISGWLGKWRSHRRRRSMAAGMGRRTGQVRTIVHSSSRPAASRTRTIGCSTARLPDSMETISTGAARSNGCHDLMRDVQFGNGSQHIAGTDAIAGFAQRLEIPLPSLVEREDIAAPFEEESVLFGQFGQRVLQSVENHAQQARAEVDREESPGQIDLIAVTHSVRFLKHLQVGDATVNAEDFRLELFLAHDHVRHFILHDRAPLGLDRDDVSVDADDGRLCRMLFRRDERSHLESP